MAARSVGGAITGPTLAVKPKTAWTDPTINDLVIWDTTGNYFVDECVTDETPVGRVIAVAPDKLTLTIELFAAGCVAVLPYSVAPALGDKVEVGAVVNQVRVDNSTGSGRVISLDQPTGFVHVYYQ